MAESLKYQFTEDEEIPYVEYIHSLEVNCKETVGAGNSAPTRMLFVPGLYYSRPQTPPSPNILS